MPHARRRPANKLYLVALNIALSEDARSSREAGRSLCARMHEAVSCVGHPSPVRHILGDGKRNHESQYREAQSTCSRKPTACAVESIRVAGIVTVSTASRLGTMRILVKFSSHYHFIPIVTWVSTRYATRFQTLQEQQHSVVHSLCLHRQHPAILQYCLYVQ